MDPTSEAYFSETQDQVLHDLDNIPPKYPWLTPTIMNVMSGTVAGLAGVIAGHPFDTVKVRLQNQKLGTDAAYKGTFHTFSRIIKDESVFGLFKGMSSPLVGVAVINAFLFGVYGCLLDVQKRWQGNSQTSLAQVFWAGAGSGLVNSFISGPTELAKIQLQIQTNSGFKNEKLRGPVDCLKRIYKADGFKGLARGMNSTMLRETPSYGVYFATFELMQQKFMRSVEEDSETSEGRVIQSMKLMMAGGLSGVFGWISTYPIDVVKTRIQAQPIIHNTHTSLYKGIWDCTKQIVRAEGIGVLWRGLGATVIRAFPTNAVIFLAYSNTLEALERINYPQEYL